MSFFNLICELVVLLLLILSQSVPPLAQYLGDGPVVLVWMFLVDQRSMSLTEYHEGIHWSPYLVPARPGGVFPLLVGEFFLLLVVR